MNTVGIPMDISNRIRKGMVQLKQKEADVAEREQKAQAEKERLQRLYHDLILNILPDALRPYAVLDNVVWQFAVEPTGIQPSEKILIRIPGLPEFYAAQQYGEMQYLIPRLRVVDDEAWLEMYPFTVSSGLDVTLAMLSAMQDELERALEKVGPGKPEPQYTPVETSDQTEEIPVDEGLSKLIDRMIGDALTRRGL